MYVYQRLNNNEKLFYNFYRINQKKNSLKETKDL